MTQVQIKVGRDVVQLLADRKIEYKEVNGDIAGYKSIVSDILNRLKENENLKGE